MRRRRSAGDEAYWRVFADLGQALSLVLFLIVLFQFIRHNGIAVRKRVQTAQEGVDSIIKAALPDSTWRDKFLVCLPDGDRQKIVFGAEALFPSGSPTVQNAGVKLFERIGLVLGTVDEFVDQVSVEGHTDTVRVVNDSIQSNWELSALRALRVSEILLRDSALDDRKLSVAGRGEWQQILPNTSDSGRMVNRRVEITLVYSQDRLGGMEQRVLEARLDSLRAAVRSLVAKLPPPPEFLPTSVRPQCPRPAQGLDRPGGAASPL